MPNRTFWRAIHSLAHPLTIAMVVLALLNDHVLRQHWSSWWTGKLSDFAWLAFAPLLLAVLLAWLVPARLQRRDAMVGWLAFGIVGLGFALAKTIPLVHGLAKGALETLIGGQVTLVVDPTDLVTLPALLIGWFIWQKASDVEIQFKAGGWVVLVLGALATVATSYPPPDYGVACFLNVSGSVIVTIPTNFYDRPSPVITNDGGLTWQATSLPEEAQQDSFDRLSGCPRSWQEWQDQETWVLTEPTDETQQYRFRPGQGVDISSDGGESWTESISLVEMSREARALYHDMTAETFAFIDPGPLNAIIDEQTGNLILAMGHDGVLVRTRDDKWQWVNVGPYGVQNLDEINARLRLLRQEIILGLLLAGLTLSTIVEPLRNEAKWLRMLLLLLAWVAWAMTTLFYSPIGGINSYGRYEGLIFLTGIGLAALTAIVLMALNIVDVLAEKPKALLAMLAITLIGILLFLFPYILWVQGAIQHYSMATLFALALTAATIYAGQQYMKRVFQGKPLMRKRKKVDEGDEP